MKSRSLLPAVAALALTITACQGEAGPLSNDDVAAIRATTDPFAQAVLSDDWAAWAAGFTEDAVFMPPNQPLVQGRAALQAWGEAYPTTTQFTITQVEIDGGGDLAVVRGAFSITVVPEGALEPITDTGKYLELRRQQPDGSWLIAAGIYNSDLPLPE